MLEVTIQYPENGDRSNPGTAPGKLMVPVYCFYRYGALDAKTASSSSFPSLELTAVAGPTHGPLHAPFDWSSTNLSSIPKFRPIEKFDFEPITKHWSTKKLDRKLKV